MAIRRQVWLVVVASLGLGCGLADYEKRIDQQRARLRVVDEENKLLGDMFEPPSGTSPDGKEGPRIPFDIFLRLPQGILPALPEKDASYIINDLTIYRFAGFEGHYVFLAAAQTGPRDPKDAKKGEQSPDEFLANFRLGIQQILKKKVFQRPEVKRESRPATTYGTEKPVELEFDTFFLEDDPNQERAAYVKVFIDQKGPRLLGLAYQVPQNRKLDATKSIDMSVQSLDIGDTAGAKRTAFSTSRRLD